MLVVAVLLKAGLQVPVIEFVEVVGKVNAAPEQMDDTIEKLGLTFEEEILMLSAFIEPTNNTFEVLDDV